MPANFDGLLALRTTSGLLYEVLHVVEPARCTPDSDAAIPTPRGLSGRESWWFGKLFWCENQDF